MNLPPGEAGWARKPWGGRGDGGGAEEGGGGVEWGRGARGPGGVLQGCLQRMLEAHGGAGGPASWRASLAPHPFLFPCPTITALKVLSQVLTHPHLLHIGF